MEKDFFWGVLILSVGVLHLIALRKKWGWYMNNYQSAPMREQWGEEGFALYSYLVFSVCIALGLMLIFKIPFPNF